ncbi:MAG: DUF1599 domain-containing protein [Muribaculaceae bacterium]|nr:DUF1599 domain-containing protein [Bacteroidales bacterium]MBD5327468.1 DUF1599 domain-containing protein [Bacteroides sp.]MDE6222745.1 DUF1599 domain-containing protein [Muribaculaceae bacterium]MBD5415394.1 DUF1599 domain-containing protein [Bacteroides sp.]MBD5425287.1 DUF1599 domain-containing protein [Bacteroides sp.]
MTTNEQFDAVMAQCRALFAKKLHDYRPAWRVLRPASLTDQIYIKAKRIRQLQMLGGDTASAVGEGIVPEFIGIINYGIIGLIQLELEPTCAPDIDEARALELYDANARLIRDLLIAKNHDYGEAWRDMRVSSYVDLILMKILRTKQIEDLGGETLVSEGIDANYMDMVNYSVFALIKLTL